jgi:hypothetical protein
MAKKGEYKRGASADSIRQRAYNSSEEQKKRRAERNHARAIMERKGAVKKGDKKDVDHKNHNTSDKSSKNLSVMSRSKNRAMNQHDPRMKRKKK